MIRIINNHKKEWIALIHCVCGTERIFKYQLYELSNKYNIIIVRLAGHEIKPDISQASINYVVEELNSFLANNSIKKIDLLGLSLGAMIGSEFVTKYPDKVNKSYLIGCLYGFSIPLFKTGYMLLMKIKSFIPRSIYMFFITYAILPGGYEKKQRKKLYEASIKMDKAILYAWMEEMGRFICKGKQKASAISSLNSDVKLIYGKRDVIFLNYAKRYVKTNKLVIVENSGHLVNIHKEETINNMIVGDLNEANNT